MHRIYDGNKHALGTGHNCICINTYAYNIHLLMMRVRSEPFLLPLRLFAVSHKAKTADNRQGAPEHSPCPVRTEAAAALPNKKVD